MLDSFPAWLPAPTDEYQVGSPERLQLTINQQGLRSVALVYVADVIITLIWASSSLSPSFQIPKISATRSVDARILSLSASVNMMLE
jgi:hypothetical protein